MSRLLFSTTTRRAGLLVCGLLLTTVTAVHGQLLGRLSEEEEIELGQLAAAEIEKGLTLLADEIVTTYVAELGQALAAKSARRDLAYHVKVVDTGQINAFALPGGFIYVHRGLLDAADTESELAGVLGHEIGHVVARHGAEQAQRAAVADLGLRVLGSVLGSGTGGQIGTMAAEMVTAGTSMQFSRDAEREADRLGAENVVAGGYDPHGMMTFFEKLDALREGQANVVERFFASHPSPSERVSNIQDLVDVLTDGPDLAVSSEGFRDMKTRLGELPPPPPPPAAPSSADTVEARSSPDAAPPEVDAVEVTYSRAERDYEIAARFAPVLRQALGSSPRYDYITRFDFDGDWRGDNNWDNVADDRHALPAVVYFNVSETTTHFFIHYAVFHPRDYKGGNVRGVLLSEILREGAARHGDYDPTGLAQEAVLAHENDMEGALVVAAKARSDLEGVRVVYVETLAHNQFLKYEVTRSVFEPFGGLDSVRVEDEHPVLYIEPKGHGIDAYRGGTQLEDVEGFITYRYGGEVQVATATGGEQGVGYDLISLADTLWPMAQQGENATYGGAFDYRAYSVNVVDQAGNVSPREVYVGWVGSSLRGAVGGRNMARPPWGWFDRDERDRRQGEWFLAPAETVKRHFDLDETFSTVYVHHPVLDVFRD